jgi:putative flippase GtrA
MISRITSLLGPRHGPLAAEFLRFGIVGASGMMVETATIYGLRGAIGLYWSGALAYLAAATSNWLVNRLWTFRGKGAGPMHRQWAKFLAANALGFVINRGTYFTLITVSATAYAYPIIAIVSGTLVGMFLNFHLSRTMVFR